MANAGISREESLIPSTIPTSNTPSPSEPNLRTMDVNLTGTLYTVKLAIHYLLLNPASPSRGSIIITASNAGIYPFPVAPLYGACKAALVNLVRSMGPPLQPLGIRINGLAPAVLETNIAPSKDLFKGMILTPMSTLQRAVEGFESDEKRTGVVVEVHGESVTVREAPGYVDSDSESNLKRFWGLGYA
jgi:NAD(P)-dependent dehydrogenase (short-subunit alcohol dehydrogenase family)